MIIINENLQEYQSRVIKEVDRAIFDIVQCLKETVMLLPDHQILPTGSIANILDRLRREVRDAKEVIP